MKKISIELSENQIGILNSAIANHKVLKDFSVSEKFLLCEVEVSQDMKKAIIETLKSCKVQVVKEIARNLEAGTPKKFPARKLNGYVASANQLVKKFSEAGVDLNFTLSEKKQTFKFK